MTKTSIKVVRPWPAEQPRPPVTHRTQSLKAAPVDRHPAKGTALG